MLSLRILVLYELTEHIKCDADIVGPSVVYAVAVNCLYKDRVSRVRVRVRDMDRVSGRVRFRV